MVSTVLLVLAVVCFVVSVVGSLGALSTYLKRENASLFGFGFAEFYWGEMRRTHAGLFRASALGALLGIAFVIGASVMR